jgi:hypothetical protein
VHNTATWIKKSSRVFIFSIQSVTICLLTAKDWKERSNRKKSNSVLHARL